MKPLILEPGERLFSEKRHITFRKEEYEYLHTGIIDENGEMWTTTELDEANLFQVYNQYREKHGIPFPDEIARLREFYGVPATKMSEILGFGINQYRYYEGGEVPSLSNARILMAIRDKETFMEFLDAAKEVIGKKDYDKIRNRLLAKGEYVKPVKAPSSFTGYVSVSMEKIRATMLYFIKQMSGVYVTKMNKLLFYADFLSYKRHGYGITGLQYAALQYGPVPKNWGSVYDSVPDVLMNECLFFDQSSGIKLESDAEPDLSILDEVERSVLADVCQRFKDSNVKQISSASHEEKGWIDNRQQKSLIDYSYAFDLSMV